MMAARVLLGRSTTLLCSGFIRLGTKNPQFGFWGGESREAAIQADQYARKYQNAWFVEILQATEMKVHLSRKFGNIIRGAQQTGHQRTFRTMSTHREFKLIENAGLLIHPMVRI
jgi:hypothetical protein